MTDNQSKSIVALFNNFLDLQKTLINDITELQNEDRILKKRIALSLFANLLLFVVIMIQCFL